MSDPVPDVLRHGGGHCTPDRSGGTEGVGRPVPTGFAHVAAVTRRTSRGKSVTVAWTVGDFSRSGL